MFKFLASASATKFLQLGFSFTHNSDSYFYPYILCQIYSFKIANTQW